MEALATDLGLGDLKPAGRSTLLEAIDPRAPICALGVYDGGLFFADSRLVEGAAADPANKVLGAILRAYPSATALVMELHSVSNYFGYALYEQGKLVRGHMGVEGEGTLYEFGEPLPEERPVYEGSIVREGQRLFRTEFEGEVSEVDSSAVGEALAFAVSARLLGKPFDQLRQAVATEVELFERVAKPVWKRLLGLR